MKLAPEKKKIQKSEKEIPDNFRHSNNKLMACHLLNKIK